MLLAIAGLPKAHGDSRHIEMQDLTPGVTDDEETIEYAEGDGRNREEVHRGNGLAMVSKVGDKIRVNLRHGKIEDAIVKAIINQTDGLTLQVDVIGLDITTLIDARQVVGEGN